MNRSMWAIIAIAMLLSGCAAYRFEGKDYASAEEFQRAAGDTYRQTEEEVVAQTRIAAPISSKHLIIGVPTVDAYIGGYRITNPAQQPLAENLALANRKEMQMVASIVNRVGIYKSITIIDPSGGHSQPSSTNSVLYFYIVGDGRGGQWYINGGKGGLQALNVDRGQPTLAGKVISFINSLKAYALTD